MEGTQRMSCVFKDHVLHPDEITLTRTYGSGQL